MSELTPISMMKIDEKDKYLIKSILKMAASFLKVKPEVMEKVWNYLPELLVIASESERGKEILEDLGIDANKIIEKK